MTTEGVPILVEGFVVRAVVAWLEGRGWAVTAVQQTADRGDDIVALNAGRRLVVEAKGAGSSSAGSKRYGKSFTSGQVSISSGMATWTAMRASAKGHLSGIALPDNAAYRREVEPTLPALARVPIAVFWVSEDGTVAVSNGSVVGVT